MGLGECGSRTRKMRARRLGTCVRSCSQGSADSQFSTAIWADGGTRMKNRDATPKTGQRLGMGRWNSIDGMDGIVGCKPRPMAVARVGRPDRREAREKRGRVDGETCHEHGSHGHIFSHSVNDLGWIGDHNAEEKPKKLDSARLAELGQLGGESWPGISRSSAFSGWRVLIGDFANRERGRGIHLRARQWWRVEYRTVVGE